MAGIMQEAGRVGRRVNGGVMHEEFLPELSGRRGAQVYQEMADNDDIVGAVLYAVEMLIRQAKWDVEPASGADVDRRAAEFVSSCLGDMQYTWTDTLSEILSFLTFGWSYHEIVYKRRDGAGSKYDDGLIGWQKLPVRAQDSLARWEFDERDNLVGMTQYIGPGMATATIPIEKALHFRTKARKDSPEGRSILRSAYRSWYFKRRLQELEGIGLERDLAGLPVITAPSGMDIWADDEGMRAKYDQAMALVTGIRRDAREGIVLPGAPTGDMAGWQLTLLSSGGKRAFDTNAIIERYDTRIAMCALADFVLLGHQNVGSFALSSDKTALFGLAVGAYLDIICEVFNGQAIPRLMALNRARFGGAGLPKLVHGDIETPDLGIMGAFIEKMAGAGVLSVDGALEDYVRQAAGLPRKDGA